MRCYEASRGWRYRNGNRKNHPPTCKLRTGGFALCDRKSYECLSASFPAFYLVVSGKKRHFAAKLDIELNGWRMKQYGKRYEPESGDVDYEYHHITKGLYATFSSWQIDHSTLNIQQSPTFSETFLGNLLRV